MLLFSLFSLLLCAWAQDSNQNTNQVGNLQQGPLNSVPNLQGDPSKMSTLPNLNPSPIALNLPQNFGMLNIPQQGAPAPVPSPTGPVSSSSCESYVCTGWDGSKDSGDLKCTKYSCGNQQPYGGGGFGGYGQYPQQSIFGGSPYGGFGQYPGGAFGGSPYGSFGGNALGSNFGGGFGGGPAIGSSYGGLGQPSGFGQYPAQGFSPYNSGGQPNFSGFKF